MLFYSARKKEYSFNRGRLVLKTTQQKASHCLQIGIISLIFVVFLITQDLAFFILSTTTSLLFYTLIVSKKNTEQAYLFTLFFFIYLVTSLFVYFIQDAFTFTPFSFSDTTSFFHTSFSSLSPASYSTLYYAYPDQATHPQNFNWPGYYLLLTFLGQLLNLIGGNTLLAIKLSSVIFGSLSIVYAFELFNLQLNNDHKALKLALVFGLLPITILISSVLLRDIIIVFFTIYMLVNLLHLTKQPTLNVLSKTIVSILILYSLRHANGLYMGGFAAALTVIIIWPNLSKVTKQLTALTLLLIASIFAYTIYANIILKAIYVINDYQSLGLQNASSDSLGRYILLMPYPIEMLFRTLISQLMPFPFWGLVTQDKLFLILSMPNGLIWFPIFCLSIVTIILKRFRQHVDKTTLWLYIFSLLYICLVASGSLVLRRFIALYPPILLVAYIGYSQLPSRIKRIYIVSMGILFIILHLVYTYIK